MTNNDFSHKCAYCGVPISGNKKYCFDCEIKHHFSNYAITREQYQSSIKS